MSGRPPDRRFSTSGRSSNRRAAARTLAVLALAGALGACAGGYRNSIRRLGPAPAEPAGSPLGIVGTIDPGSPTVAGLTVLVDDTVPVSFDGAAVPLERAQPGMVAMVEARETPRGIVADAVSLRSEVSGPIAVLDPARAELVILGQTVRVTAATIHDGSIPSFAALAPRQWLRVSGLRDGGGAIVATRLDRRDSGVGVVRGTATEVIGSAFRIGPLLVEGAGVPRELADGRSVLAVGTQTAVGLRSVRVVIDPLDPFGGRMPRVVVEGFTQPAGTPGQLFVGGFRLSVPPGTPPLEGARVIADARAGPGGRYFVDTLVPR